MEQPVFFQVSASNNASIHVQPPLIGHQYDQWHFHPEHQISFILEGEGSCRIGACEHSFRTGEVYLIGSGQPHVFRSPEAKILSVFFKDTSFGGYFFQLPEMTGIRNLLAEAAQGFLLLPALAAQVGALMQSLASQNGAARLIRLLDILHLMASSSQKQLLSPALLEAGEFSPALYRRMKKVFRYLADNFHRPISLDDAARSVHLSRYAFSRYFKKMTNKSFVHYLNELRIKAACRFLLDSEYTIAQIGYLSGFNNLSNFNRHFKKLIGCTPSEYRVGVD